MTMKDNWNILAKLLDTPGSSEPPAEAKQESKPASTEPADSATSSESTKSAQTDAAPSTPAPTTASAPSKAGSILDALKAKIPPQILPGFGSSNAAARSGTDKKTSATESVPATQTVAAEVPESVATPRTHDDSAEASSEEPDGQSDDPSASEGASEGAGGWSDLVSELGIDEPPEPKQEAPRAPRARRTESAPKSATRGSSGSEQKKSAGFATGLGLDGAEPEQEEPQDTTPTEASSEDPLASASAFG